MSDHSKTKAELIQEVTTLRQEVARLQAQAKESELAAVHSNGDDILTQAGDLLQPLLDNLPDWIFIKDAESRIIRSNKAHAQVLGLDDPQGAVGKTDFDFFPVEDADRFYQEEQDFLEAGQPIIGRVGPTPAPDGEILWRSETKVPLRDEAGRIIGLIGVSRDVTELKRVEIALRASEARYRALYTKTPAMLDSIDADGNIVDVSDYFLEVFGYERDEIIGWPVTDFMTAASRVYAETVAIPQLIETGQIRDLSYQYLKKNGEVISTLVSAVAEYDEAGNFTHSLAVLNDVTERKRTEEALRESQAQLSEALEIARLGYWEFDVENQSFIFNDQFYRLLHTTVEAEGGYLMPVSDFARKYLHPEDAPRVAANIQNALETSDPNFSHQEVSRLIRADGEICHTLVRFRILKNEAGQTIKLIGANQDVTEQKEAEEALRESQERSQTILESVTVPLLISAVADGKILYVNQPLAETLLTSLEALVGQQTPNFYVDPADRKKVVGQIQAQGYVTNYELQLRRNNGDLFWALLTARLINFQSQPAIITTLIDITERKNAQELLVRRAAELEAVAEVSTAAATILQPERLLQEVADLTKARFGLYHAHIYLLDPAGDRLHLAAGAGQIGRQMVAEGWSISLLRAKSLVAQAVRERQGVIVNDVQADPSFLPNPLLPDTRSEMAVPMIVGDQLLGVLDVQADVPDHFTVEDVRVQTTLAAQVAVALQNARSYALSQDRARHEQILRQITSRVRGSTNPDAIVRTAVRELGAALDRPTFIRLGKTGQLRLPKTEGEALPPPTGDNGHSSDRPEGDA